MSESGDRPAEASSASGRDRRWAGRTVPAIGLLPLRLFLGVTYLYAGIDKFASPHFLADGDPMNVAAQMHGYANFSPLAPLINATMPMAIPIGALIALAELAIGLGLLTGLAFRLAAWSGAALSVLFWLTASWSSTPYFFSPDLPYAFGFLTLALVGHGGLYVLNPFGRRGQAPATDGVDHAALAAGAAPANDTRRAFLQVGLLALLTMAAAALALPLRALGFGGPGGSAATPSKAPATPAPTAKPTATPAPTEVPPTAAATAAPTAAATPTPTAPPTAAPTAAPTAPPASAGGSVIGNVADFANGANGLPITIPMDAPFAAGPGGPGIMVQLPDGSVAAYGAICTHGRCIVGWDASTGIIQCPCHTARFDPAAHAAVLSGPAPFPLPEIPVVIGPDGVIHMGPV